MLNYSANGPSGYNLTNSLRFRSSASAYLSRTPASTGNRKTFTYSFWIKRGRLSTLQRFIGASDNATGDFIIAWNSSDALDIYDYTSPTTNVALTTTQVFRDPSSWYHIVIAFDTTQATAANRIKVYINGSQVTAFSSTTYPAQNANLYNNQAGILATIGIWPSGSQYFDGYMDEFNFIDGQALTPSSFGSTNSITGVWQPAKYTGTYGTNGFYLNFTDIALTSGSNTGLGKDFSGNGNFWNTNNISVTSGSTYDAMSDVPTLTNATVANYAVINPLDFISANGTISSANLNWASSTNICGNRATIGSNSGKWYWEAIGSSVTSGTIGGRFAFTGSDTIAAEQDKFGMYWHPTSGIARIVNGVNTYVTSAYTYTNSDVLALALDLDNNISYWYKNGVLQYTYDFSAYSTIGTRIFFPYVWNASSGTPSWVYNFGQRGFAYTPPTGYVALNTYNLPTPTILQGNKYMDATLYTGTGIAQSITNASSFKPDLVWIKSRVNNPSGGALNHELTDSVRGATKELNSNNTGAETTNSAGLTAFNSNGFTVGGDYNYNNPGNGGAMVGWQWQAGQGSTSSNTSGSITSTVSVNTTAGFSIVTYTGNATNNATIGHGLGVAPKMVITKNRATTTFWYVYHSSLPATYNLYLNTTDSQQADNVIRSTSATTFTVSSSSAANGTSMVAYCWAEIAGFSKFGSYTGNGSADGPFVYTGFRPKYVMIKPTNVIASWTIEDTARSTYNVMDARIFAEESSAEVSNGNGLIDYLSNGFKPRVNHVGINGSNNTMIYMAFAENPFKNALAR